MNYWKNKQDVAKAAREHTELCDRVLSHRTALTIKEATIYSNIPDAFDDGQPLFCAMKTDSVSALKAVRAGMPDARICVLNFSSYKNPGGLFLRGSSAQEESLCHMSNLYNVLRHFDGTFYDWNRKHLNRGMYLNRAIYAPHVAFTKGIVADVLTCAAPNRSVSLQYGNFTDKENDEALKSRIAFLRNILVEQNPDVFITGAYGCGVFSQDAAKVADLMREAMEKSGCKLVLAAVPDNANFAPFQKKFADKIPF